MARLAPVPVEPLRDAFLRDGRTAAEIAHALGWYTRRGYADGCRVKRVLGLSPYDPSHGRAPRYRANLTEDVATVLAPVLGVDYWEIGL